MTCQIQIFRHFEIFSNFQQKKMVLVWKFDIWSEIAACHNVVLSEFHYLFSELCSFSFFLAGFLSPTQIHEAKYFTTVDKARHVPGFLLSLLLLSLSLSFFVSFLFYFLSVLFCVSFSLSPLSSSSTKNQQQSGGKELLKKEWERKREREKSAIV